MVIVFGWVIWRVPHIWIILCFLGRVGLRLGEFGGKLGLGYLE